MGRPFSPILKFHEIHVCNWKRNRTMKLNRAERVLEIGFSFKTVGSKVREFVDKVPVVGYFVNEPGYFTADYLWKEWNNGHALNPRPYEKRGLIERILPKASFAKLSPSEYMDEFWYQRWGRYNPTGKLRKAIRVYVYKYAQDLAWRIRGYATDNYIDELKKKYDQQLNSLEGVDGELVTKVDLSDIPNDQLKTKIIAQMQDPRFLGKIVSKYFAASENFCSGIKLNTVNKRDVGEAKYYIGNAKSVSANVSFDFPFPEFEMATTEVLADTDKLCIESNVENEINIEKVKVFVDTVDNHGVSVAGLSQLAKILKALPQIALAVVIKK